MNKSTNAIDLSSEKNSFCARTTRAHMSWRHSTISGLLWTKRRKFVSHFLAQGLIASSFDGSISHQPNSIHCLRDPLMRTICLLIVAAILLAACATDPKVKVGGQTDGRNSRGAAGVAAGHSRIKITSAVRANRCVHDQQFRALPVESLLVNGFQSRFHYGGQVLRFN